MFELFISSTLNKEGPCHYIVHIICNFIKSMKIKNIEFLNGLIFYKKIDYFIRLFICTMRTIFDLLCYCMPLYNKRISDEQTFSSEKI